MWKFLPHNELYRHSGPSAVRLRYNINQYTSVARAPSSSYLRWRMFMHEAMTIPARGVGAWVGALVVSVGLLGATPATGQLSAVKFDPDAAEKRLRVGSEQFPRGGLDNSIRPAVAERTGAVPQLDPNRLIARPGFLEGHLLPRMTRHMGDVASVNSLETQRVQFENSGIHHWVSYEVEQRAQRAARKAARDYLYEITAFGAWIESMCVGQQSPRGAGERRGMNVGFDVTHGIPKVGMRHYAAAGTTRFVVGLDSSVRLDFYPTRWKVARFYAGYEPERSVYRVAYRLGF